MKYIVLCTAVILRLSATYLYLQYMNTDPDSGETHLETFELQTSFDSSLHKINLY